MSNDYKGFKYHKITVLKKTKEFKKVGKGRLRLWECLCDCGKTFKLYSKQIWRKSPKSCGCWSGNDPINTNAISCRSHYINTAKNKNLEFSLTKEKFKFLIYDNCFYCGSPPAQINKLKDNPYLIPRNGIDRINSSKGYTDENSVTCCKICNSMKSSLSQEDFIKHIVKLIKNLHSKKLLPYKSSDYKMI